MVAGKLDLVPALPPEGPLRAARVWARRCGSTTPTSASTTTCATPPIPAPGTEEQLRTDGRACLLPAPRPGQAAVGAVDGRGPRGRSLGAAVEGPPLHGRRRRRDRPDVGDVLRRPPTRRRRTPLVGPAPSPRASRSSCATLVPPRDARPAARGDASRAAHAARSCCSSLGEDRRAPSRRRRRRCARSAVLADRPDRTAPALELGGRPPRAMSRTSASASAAPSTTWC